MAIPTLSLPSPLAPLGLTRDDAHVYAWNDGMKVYWPLGSVTAALQVINKPAVVGWVRRETAEFAVTNLDSIRLMRDETGHASAVEFVKMSTDRRRDKAGRRGTNVHQIAEQIVRGQTPEIPEDLAAYVVSYRAFLREWQPKFVAVEKMVVNLTHGYAGTFDAFAKIGNERWLLDIKTSTGVYAETALQLSAYAAAEFIGVPGDPTRYRVPRAQRFGVIHVTEQSAELVPMTVTRETFRRFLEARNLWQWTQTQAKTVVGRPLTKEKAQ